jgi:cytoskeletal protein CcmA (bactofilin family)
MWNQDETRNATGNAVRPAPGSPTEKRVESAQIRALNLGRSVVVKGEMTGAEDLAVDGRVEGRIDLPDHVLTIGPNAEIQADITGRVVVIFGTVVGTVKARERVDVRVGGSLDGELMAPSVVVQDGAFIGGKVDMPRPARKRDQGAPVALAPVA